MAGRCRQAACRLSHQMIAEEIEAAFDFPDFAAAHESGSGTNRTNRAGLMMSVDRGRPEVTF
jgi:hypothetical protein